MAITAPSNHREQASHYLRRGQALMLRGSYREALMNLDLSREHAHAVKGADHQVDHICAYVLMAQGECLLRLCRMDQALEAYDRADRLMLSYGWTHLRANYLLDQVEVALLWLRQEDVLAWAGRTLSKVSRIISSSPAKTQFYHGRYHSLNGYWLCKSAPDSEQVVTAAVLHLKKAGKVMRKALKNPEEWTPEFQRQLAEHLERTAQIYAEHRQWGARIAGYRAQQARRKLAAAT